MYHMWSLHSACMSIIIPYCCLVEGLTPIIITVSNVSLYNVSCSWVLQLLVVKNNSTDLHKHMVPSLERLAEQ